MKHKKRHQMGRFDEPEIAEKENERSRQEAMAARERSTRSHISAGQANVQRMHKGNQPRGR